MRKYIQTCIPLIMLFIAPDSNAQQNKSTINYGSNATAAKYITTRGVKFYCEVYGKGEPLLLIHGNSGSMNNFKYQIPYFSKYYKVIAVDSRAQGKSTDYGDSLTYQMMADDFNAAANVADGDDTDEQGLIMDAHFIEKASHPTIRFIALARFTDDVRINQIHGELFRLRHARNRNLCRRWAWLR